TRKLSFSAPMVVGGCPPVRVGRCRAIEEHLMGVLFLCVIILAGLFFLLKMQIGITSRIDAPESNYMRHSSSLPLF
uniref:hypothetical protein n=1 Tax=Cytobacillus firmus TaxID=1399 RepID=UPI001C2F0854